MLLGAGTYTTYKSAWAFFVAYPYAVGNAKAWKRGISGRYSSHAFFVNLFALGTGGKVILRAMNKTRRRQIAKALSLIEQAYDLLTEVKDDEEMAYENLPESLQSSEKGDTMQNNISNLEDAISGLEDVQSSLEGIE